MTRENLEAVVRANRAVLVAKYAGRDLPSKHPKVRAAIAVEDSWEREEWLARYDTNVRNAMPESAAITDADIRIAGVLFDRAYFDRSDIGRF